jgi:hypothetical protein
MDKYDILKFIQVRFDSDDNVSEIVRTIELTKDGNSVVGILPGTGEYILIGSNKTVENPKTGVATYGTTGLIAIIALGGAYMVCKKKMSN